MNNMRKYQICFLSIILYFLLFVSSFASNKILTSDIELENTTLQQVIKKLENYFSVEILLDKKEVEPIDVYFIEGQSLEEILDMLAESSNKRVEKKSETVYQLTSEINEVQKKRKEYLLKYISSDEAVKVLQQLYGDEVKAASVTTRNKLLVIAEERVLEEIEKEMLEIDVPQRQVKIQAQILDISKDLFRELGFDWLYNKPNTEIKNTKVSLLSEESSGGIAPVLGSKISLVRQFSSATEALGLSFHLLEANQDLRVSSSPSMVIASGAKGEFKITEEIIVGQKKEKKRGEDIVTEPIFKEAGLILEVTPHIHEDLSVTLDLHLEVSDFKYRKGLNSNENWDFNGQGGSKIGRNLSTKIHVNNHETILIGGLSRSSNRNAQNKVPFLGDIPIIRYLFRSESKREEITDTYIKIFVEVC